MERKNTLIGIILILFGISLYLKRFHISASDSFILFLGLFLLYLYYMKRQQPFILFGSIFTAIGVLAVLDDLRLFNGKLDFEILLIIAGTAFIFLYFQRGIRSFVYPGFLLPAFGIYMILESVFGKKHIGPAFFILLGIAFCFIYFAAFWGGSSWPLIAGMALIFFGIYKMGTLMGLIAFNIQDYSAYFLPALLILGGIALLYKSIKTHISHE